MPTTPEYDLPYPAPTDTPDVPYWQQQLAEAVDAAIGDRNKHKHGRKLMTPTAPNTIVSATVTFTEPFPAGYVVTVTLTPSTVANAQCFAYPSGESTTGFTLNFRRDAATATNVMWQAQASPAFDAA